MNIFFSQPGNNVIIKYSLKNFLKLHLNRLDHMENVLIIKMDTYF